MNTFRRMVADELARANAANKPLNSHHEAFGVILEEVDELWEHVRKKRSERNPAEVLAELVQIAAMAERAAVDLGLVTKFSDGPPHGEPCRCARCIAG